MRHAILKNNVKKLLLKLHCAIIFHKFEEHIDSTQLSFRDDLKENYAFFLISYIVTKRVRHHRSFFMYD